MKGEIKRDYNFVISVVLVIVMLFSISGLLIIYSNSSENETAGSLNSLFNILSFNWLFNDQSIITIPGQETSSKEVQGICKTAEGDIGLCVESESYEDLVKNEKTKTEKPIVKNNETLRAISVSLWIIFMIALIWFLLHSLLNFLKDKNCPKTRTKKSNRRNV